MVLRNPLRRVFYCPRIMEQVIERAQFIGSKPWAFKRANSAEKKDGVTRAGGVMEATPPATPRHTMFPLWLLPSGPDQVNG
jgi:hypothetical protein